MHDIRTQLGTRFCRQCEICLPCPQEVFIPTVMVAPILWKLWPRKLFLSGWIAEEMESGRNCNQCGECEEKCPYDLPIQQMIVENLEFYDSVVQGKI